MSQMPMRTARCCGRFIVALISFQVFAVVYVDVVEATIFEVLIRFSEKISGGA